VTALGWLAVAAALVLAGAGRTAAGRTPVGRADARRVRVAAGGPGDANVPLLLDLVAAALRAGRPLPDALELAAPAGAPATAARLVQVARLLRLGAEPERAWAAVAEGPLRPLLPVAVRSAASGLKLASAFERLAAELRAERAAADLARASRAGVLALAPLAACFLPSFVCLGVVPTVAGVVGAALGGTL
jgi:Flp pilus assembly protein TadB